MTSRQYSINGKVIREGTNQGVANLRVEAWNKHLKFFKERVSHCITDEQGRFLIEFSEAQLHKCLLQPNPDLFFKIFDKEELIYSTENFVLWNLGQSDLGTADNPLIIAVDLPEIPEPLPTYTVKGYVRNQEGQPQANVTVRVYDIALDSQPLLGETTTDEAGKYKIDYQPSKDEQNIDRVVRVCDEADNQLYEVSIVDKDSITRNLRLVQHNFGNEPPQPSEEEQLQTNLKTFLQDKTLSELNPTDLALLAEKTDLNAEHLTSLFLSNQLAQQTNLPAELFYGLLRQQLPTQLLPLLNLSPQTWRTALEKALENNQIPASFRDNLDTYIEQLQQKAEEAKTDNQSGTTTTPRIKLNSRLLNRSVLDNLKEEADSSHDYLNQTLNATLKQVLSDSLANQGYVGLATFVKTMPDTDLGQEAETSLRDFMAAQVDRARQQSNFSNIYKSLSDAVQTLSTSTTLSQLLGLDASLETHPLFDYTAQLTRVHSLLDTSSLLSDRSLQTSLIEKYQAHEGSIQEFWQSLRETEEFGAEKVTELQFTFQLGTLTQNNALLVEQLRDRLSQQNSTPTLRNLTQLNLNDWAEVIKNSAAEEEELELPENIDERITNYAKLLMMPIEQAFPTDFVAKTVINAPQVHPTSLHDVLKQHKKLNFQDPLPENLQLPEELTEELKILQQEIRQFPDFDYIDALNRFNENGRAISLNNLNPIRRNLTQFFNNAPDFDFRWHRVDDYLEEHSETAFRDIPYSEDILQSEQYQVRQQLKRMQRIFEIAPHAESMQTLMNHGFHSAFSVCQMPYKLFVRAMGDRLGGAVQANEIYSKAQQKVAKIVFTTVHAYQNKNDILPFVLGGDLRNLNQASTDESPNWQNLFGNISLCECKHCRSVYSPSAYLVELLEFINPKISLGKKRPIEVLKQRRPDLMDIKLTCENAETPLPYIDLVNEILEYYVVHQKLTHESHNTEDVTAAELRANPQFILTEAYRILKEEAIYPFSLPFDRDLEIARVYLEHLGSSRYELMHSLLQPQLEEETNNASTSISLLENSIFIPDNPPILGSSMRTINDRTAIAAEYLGISPSECETIVGYRPLYPFEAYGYSIFEFGSSSLFESDGKHRIVVSELIQCLGISYVELRELLKTRFINRDRSLQFDPENPEESNCDLSQTYLVPSDKNAEQDSIRGIVFNYSHRFIRLWQRLDISILDLDRCIASLQPNNINEEFICKLASAKKLQARLDISFAKLLSLWANIDTHGEGSLYHQLFLNKAALEIDLAFEPKNGVYLSDGEEDISEHIPTLLAGFRISADDLQLIQLDSGINNDSYLTLNNVSALYRYTVLAKALKLRINEFLSIKTLADINSFESPDRTAAFVELVEKVEDSEFSITELNYLYRHLFNLPNPFQLERESFLLLVANLRKGLKQIVEETQIVDDPTGENTRNKLTTLFGEEIANKTVSIILTTSKTHTAPVQFSVGKNLSEKIKEIAAIELSDEQTLDEKEISLIIKRLNFSLPTETIQNVDSKIYYDSNSKILYFTGIMNQEEKDRLLSASESDDRKLLVRPTDLPPEIELTDENKQLILAEIEAAIIETRTDTEAWANSIEQLFKDSEKTIQSSEVFSQDVKNQDKNASTFIEESEKFIRNSFVDFFDSEDVGAIASIIELFLNTPPVHTSSVKDNGKPDPEAITAKFNYLMPYIRDRLSRNFIKQTLSETLELEPEMVGLLVEKILFASHQDEDKEQDFAIADIFNLRTISIEESAGNSEVTYQEGRYQGYLEIPEDADYRFYINEVSNIKIWLGDRIEPIIPVPNEEENQSQSALISLKAGHLYPITLEIAENSQPPTIYWSHATLAKQEIPLELLYPELEVRRFEKTLIRLQKAALLINGFALTPQEIEYFAGHSWDLSASDRHFLGLNLNDLPLEETENTSSEETESTESGEEETEDNKKLSTSQVLFQQWQRLFDYVALRDRLPKNQVTLIDFFRFLEILEMEASSDRLTAAMMEQIVAKVSQDRDAIALLSHWRVISEEEIKQAIANFAENSEPFRNILSDLDEKQLLTLVLASITNWSPSFLDDLLGESGFDLRLDDLQNEIWLTRLQTCLQLVKRLGAAPDKLFDWAKPVLTNTESQDIKDTVKAKYEDETWLTVAQTLNDKLREQQRDALVDYILALDTIRNNRQIQDSNDLFEYFLIDVNMSACMLTSRLKQAISSVQLFIQRCLMNLEQPEVSPKAIADDQWEWMKRYRIWEANRKVFLYPENWIEPELRDNKSPFFKELESELLQNDLTEPYIETVFHSYLKKLDEVARLDICAMYWEGEEDGREYGQEILHVFGRAFDSPNIYYRKLINETGVWTAWELVNVGIDMQPDGVHLIPVVFNRRLYLFWPIFTEKPDDDNPAPEGVPPRMKWEIQLAWSEYWDGKWQPKQVSSTKLMSPSYFCYEDDQVSDPDPNPKREMIGYIVHRKSKNKFSWVEVEWRKITTTTITITQEHLGYLPKPKEYFFKIDKEDRAKHININTYVEIFKRYANKTTTTSTKSEIKTEKFKAKFKKYHLQDFGDSDKLQEVWFDDRGQGYDKQLFKNGIEVSFDKGEKKDFQTLSKLEILEDPAEYLKKFLEKYENEPEEESIEEVVRDTTDTSTSISLEKALYVGEFLFSGAGNKCRANASGMTNWSNKIYEKPSEDFRHNFISYQSLYGMSTVSLKTVNQDEESRVFEYGKYQELISILFSPSQTKPYIFKQPSFFYQNTECSYHVKTISVPVTITQEESDLTIPPIEEEHDFSREIQDPAGPRVNEWLDPYTKLAQYINYIDLVSGENVNVVDWLIFGHEANYHSVETQNIASSINARPQLLNSSSLPSTSKETISPQWTRILGTEKKLKFETHYHPYIDYFISRLNELGIPGLLDIETQRQSDKEVFGLYKPNAKVVCDNDDCKPIENVDFEFDGAYSLYNWELFFHIPLTIATRLSQDQRFEEAQKWFHYLFNPTDDTEPDPDKPWARYWKVKPFRKTEKETLMELMQNLHEGDIDKQIKEWREDPFKPHSIARKRLLAYQKTVVMKYIDNLIAWGDRLFRQDTIESINEATQLYILAYNILGRRPERIPTDGDVDPQTYQSLKNNYGIGSFGNALVPLEDWDSAKPKLLLSYIKATEILLRADHFVVLNNKKYSSKALPISNPQPVRLSLESVTVDESSDDNPSSKKLPVTDSSGSGNYEGKLTPSKLSSPTFAIIPTLFLPKNPIVETLASEDNEESAKTFYFCIPQNDQLLEYWDLVSDRLFKIRHCMNIEGVVRELPLYEPPIDPALLVQAAAKGIDLGSVLNDLYAPRPHYRFSYMLQKALELCAEVKSLGASLLSALEKKDAEKLSLLRAKHEISLLKAIGKVKDQQINEARIFIESLQKSFESATLRRDYYAQKPFMNAWESAYLESLNISIIFQILQGELDTIANLMFAIPDTKSGAPTTAGTTFGGSNLGNVARAFSAYLGVISSIYQTQGTMSSTLGSYRQRFDDWKLQEKLAIKELEQIDKQIDAGKIRIAIAEQERDNHKEQIKNAEAIEAFFESKYTNEELYNWMLGKISTVYFQSYKLAYDLAKRAEQAYRFEQGITNSNFIQFGYWDSLRKGLLSGEQLHLDLKRLEIEYLDANKRDYELTKHISILQLDPTALIALRTTGQCEIELPEWLFNLDYPNHYMRRIKNVSITIPCVTGPYTSVSCTLTLLKNEIRIKPTPVESYPRDLEKEDPRFLLDFAAMQSIATSTAQNDSGLFELNFRDERYLPFEGAGAISTWRIELPDPNEFPQFDYNTISDIILHLRYSAREGGQLLKNAALSAIKEAFKKVKEKPLTRLFSAKHEFSDKWHRFLNQNNTEDSHKLELPISPVRFPFPFRGKSIAVNKVEVFLIFKETQNNENSDLTLDLTFPDGNTFSSSLSSNPLFPGTAYGVFKEGENDTIEHEVKELDKWSFEMVGIENSNIEDLLILCHYSVAEKSVN